MSKLLLLLFKLFKKEMYLFERDSIEENETKMLICLVQDRLYENVHIWNMIKNKSLFFLFWTFGDVSPGF